MFSRKLVSVFVLLTIVFMGSLYADPFGSPVIYPTNPMTLYGTVKIDGAAADTVGTDDVVAAYVGTELRGKQPVVLYEGTAFVTLAIHVNTDGETVTFKVWDASEDVICTVSETTTTAIGSTVGSYPNDLFDITAVSPVSYLSVYDVQYTDTADDGTYPSPYEDQEVTVRGIVTFIGSSSKTPSFYIADSEGGAWKGLYVYNTGTAVNPSVGDDIELTGTVEEYYGLTELKDITEFTVHASGLTPPAAISLTTGTLTSDSKSNAAAEPYEGCLVQLTDAEVTAAPDGNNQWYVNDGSGICQIDDNYYLPSPAPSVDDVCTTIKGFVDYSYDEYGVHPRDASDVVIEQGADTTPPEVTSAEALSETTVKVVFNEEVNETTAETPGNYVISDSKLGVTAAELQANGTDVVLTTASQTSEANYTVTVSNVEDIAGNPISGNNTANFTGFFDTGGSDTDLVNGDFEIWVGNYPIGWTTLEDGITVVPEETIVHGGSKSGSFNVTTGEQGDTDFRQNYTVTTGTTYDVSVWVYHTEGNTQARLYVDGYRNYSDNTITGTWQEVTYEYTPSAKGVIELGLRFYDIPETFDGEEIVYIDDFTITEQGADTTPPEVISAEALSETTVKVVFNEEVDETTAENTSNYVITDMRLLSVTDAELQANGTDVILTTAAQTGLVNYMIQISNVEDIAGNVIVPNSAVYFQGYFETPPLTVYDVQYTTTADDGTYPSPYKDQEVTVRGIVTFIGSSSKTPSFYISDSDGGAWKGLYVYNTGTAVNPSVGDDVELTGTVEEYYGLTELKDITDFTIHASGLTPPAAISLTTGTLTSDSKSNAAAEPYEGCLVQLTDAEVTAAPDGNNQWYVNDGSGICQIDDNYYMPDPAPMVGDLFTTIIGFVDYSYDEYGVHPRNADDLTAGGSTTADISGTVTYFGNSGILGVTIDLTGDTEAQTTTDVSGNYIFADVSLGSVTLTPSYSENSISGINALDYIAIKKHALGIETIADGSYSWTAADVTGEGSINALDYIMIKKRILGLESTFPVGDWAFTPADIDLTLTDDVTAQDFIGIKIGDVNGNWTAPTKKAEK